MYGGALVLDGHMDTPLRLVDEGVDISARLADGHADLMRLQEGGVDAVFIDQDADRAGHGTVTIFVDDLDEWVAEIAARGLDPGEREKYSNGVRKAIYRDPDGNEIGFGGAPVR